MDRSKFEELALEVLQSVISFWTNPDVQLLNCLMHIRHHFEQTLDENRERAGPVMDAMKVWMETEGIRYSPNS